MGYAMDTPRIPRYSTMVSMGCPQGYAKVYIIPWPIPWDTHGTVHGLSHGLPVYGIYAMAFPTGCSMDFPIGVVYGVTHGCHGKAHG